MWGDSGVNIDSREEEMVREYIDSGFDGMLVG